MKSKGQVSIEYLIIFTIMLAYLNLVIMPVVSVGTTAAGDVTTFTKARMLAQDIANAIDSIGIGDTGSSRNLSLTIPTDINIAIKTTYIEFSAKMQSDYKNSGVAGTVCNKQRGNWICTGKIALGYPTTVTIGKSILLPGRKYSLHIENTGNTMNIIVNQK